MYLYYLSATLNAHAVFDLSDEGLDTSTRNIYFCIFLASNVLGKPNTPQCNVFFSYRESFRKNESLMSINKTRV